MAASTVAAALLSVSVLQAQSPEGAMWRTLDAELRLAFAAGLVKGSGDLSAAILLNADDLSPEEIKRSMAAINRLAARVTSEQLRDGLDAFFADFRNRGLDITQGAYIVLISIKGAPQPDIEKIVENWRRNAAQPK